MRYLTYFKESFSNFNIEHYKYLDLEKLENGDLKIILNSDGKEEANDYGINIDNFYDYFDDVRGNSEYLFYESISDAGLGMSEAPCIIAGYYFDDNGKLTDDGHDDSEIFWYPNYMIKDFTEELVKNGFVVFQTTKPKTQEEIEKFRLKRDTEKYNL